MKTEASVGFTTEWRANTNTNSRKPKRNVTLKPKRSEGFKEEWSAGERAKRLQTRHKVLLDSVSSSPRTRSVSAKPKHKPNQNKKADYSHEQSTLHTFRDIEGIYLRNFQSINTTIIAITIVIIKTTVVSGGLYTETISRCSELADECTKFDAILSCCSVSA